MAQDRRDRFRFPLVALLKKVAEAAEEIRRRVFEQAGESTDGFAYRCPGMECPDFRKAAGKTWAEKVEEACANCKKCRGFAPPDPDTPEIVAATEIDILLAEVEATVKERRAGFHFEIDDFEIYHLVCVWEDALAAVREIREIRLQALIRGFLEAKK